MQKNLNSYMELKFSLYYLFLAHSAQMFLTRKPSQFEPGRKFPCGIRLHQAEVYTVASEALVRLLLGKHLPPSPCSSRAEMETLPQPATGA